MRNLLMIFTLIYVLALPAQAQKNVDLSEDIAAMREDIKNLEAEIAEARVSYPEDVPELQQELATMKKMLASFEKLAGMSSAPPPVAPTPVASVKPKSTSPVVPINLNQPVKAPAPNEATDEFFGYKGRRINDSTLITPDGLIIQFQLSKNRLVCQPDSKSDPFKHIIEELEKSEQRKDELIDNFSQIQNGVLYYPQLEFSLKVYDDLEQRYTEGVNNTIEVPDLGISRPNPSRGDLLPSRGPNNGDFLNYQPSDDWQDVLAKLDAAKKRADELEAQLPPVDQFPAPPRKEISYCAFCDPKILAREKMEDEKWQKEFMEKESEIIRIRLSIARACALLGIDGYDFDLSDLMGRMSIKIKLLNDRYGKKFEYAKTVVPLVLMIERQKQLLGVEDEPGTPSGLEDMLNFDYTKMLKEQMGLKNYNFALDISQHLGFERQKQLLGVADEEDDTRSTIDMAMKFNRFALTLDLDFIYQQVDDDDKLEMKATGSISTKDKVFVMMYPVKCSWKMILYKVDYNNASEQLIGIPLEVKSGEKTVRDEDDNLVTFSHTGTKEMVEYLPEFKIDLCDISKKDSAFMMPIGLPYGTTPKVNKDLNKSYKDEMVGIASHMFTDVNKMEDNESEGMDLAADIIATLSESNVTEPTGNPKLDKMQREYNIKVKQDDHKKDLSQVALTKKSVFLFNANNGSTVFIDQTNDTKHKIDDNHELTKGVIHLRVVHDPQKSN